MAEKNKMLSEKNVSAHYQQNRLLNSIKNALEKQGKTLDAISIDDLAPVDEFHIGGRVATEHLLVQLNLSQHSQILDIGCGIGGASRFAAHHFQSRVHGIDLTPEFTATSRALCDATGLSSKVELFTGSALQMPFGKNSFNTAFMIHVGMNIEDKTRLFTEAHRVLQTKSKLGIYDVMITGKGSLDYPVPWAQSPEISALATIEDYKIALETAGFSITEQTDRKQFALDFFKQMQARFAAQTKPPALGLQLVMGQDIVLKMKNLSASIRSGYLTPVELIAEK